jgi:hypothetical protein
MKIRESYQPIKRKGLKLKKNNAYTSCLQKSSAISKAVGVKWLNKIYK